MERHAEKKGDATDLRNKLVDEVQKTHGQIQTGERMTFNDLAAICEKNFYQSAEFAEGRKISGVRSVLTAKAQLNILQKFFGKRLLREITAESLLDYKRWRLKTDSLLTGEPIKISTLNRELSAMRKMMRFAFGEKSGKPVIIASSSLLLNRSGISNDPNATLPIPRLSLDKNRRRFIFNLCSKNSLLM